MHINYNNKKKPQIHQVIFYLLFVFLMPISYSQANNQKNKIQIRPSPLSLDAQIKKTSSNYNIIEIFNSTLFNRSVQDDNSTFTWLHTTELQENRNKIMGSKSSIFETWWKINLDALVLEDRLDYTELIRTRINSKILTKLTDTFFIKGEFELLTGSGSIQKIYQRLGETNKISQLEILLIWKNNNWLTTQLGAINQSFLKSPLLLANIPFPSIIENFKLINNKTQHLSLVLQQAIPSSFSDSHSIYTQSLTKTPLFFTNSVFWYYNPHSFYKFSFNSTFFHFNTLPSDIARASWGHGNTVIEEPAQFKYRYTGIYISLEPSFQIFSSLAMKFKIHYIKNFRHMESKNLNQGILYSLQLLFDITENIRVTPVLEYFINQPDTSVGYYNSERYGHSDRTGFIGEVFFNFYARNIKVGFRHLRSRSVRKMGIKQEQVYYLFFLRTNYVKI